MQAKRLGKHMPGKLTNLTSLDLSRNHLRKEGVDALTQGCSQLTSLKHLHCGVAVGGHGELSLARRVLGPGVLVEMTGDELSDEQVAFSSTLSLTSQQVPS